MITDEERTLVEATLREWVTGLDYDLHKSLECDEETGKDTYPQLTLWFLELYHDKQIALWKYGKAPNEQQ